MTFPWEAVLVALLAAWTTGYAAGRRRGRADGFAEGLSYGPLHLKQAAWRDGRCPVCGGVASEGGDSGGDVPCGHGGDGSHGGDGTFVSKKGY